MRIPEWPLSAQYKLVTIRNMADIGWAKCLLSFYRDHVPRRSQQLGTASCSGRGSVVYHMGGALDAHDIAATSTNILLQRVILPMSYNISYLCYPFWLIMGIAP